MAANIRNLMKEKALARRIQHPFAKYDHQGRLTCSACGMVVKHETLWPSHLTSKSHRTSIQRIEKERAAAEELQEARRGKRAASDDEDGGDTDKQSAGGRGENGHPQKKARLDGLGGLVGAYGEYEEDEPSSKADLEAGGGVSSKMAAASTSNSNSGGFPTDFFSDPTRLADFQNEAEYLEEGPSHPSGAPVPQKSIQEEEDPEWAQFEAEIFNAQPTSQSGTTAAPVRPTGPTTFSTSATISVQPVLFDEAEQDGNEDAEAALDGEEQVEEEPKETEQQRREREEKEELMARIESEEREQAEADERVEVLKRRLAAVRRTGKSISPAVPPPSSTGDIQQTLPTAATSAVNGTGGKARRKLLRPPL